jgi:hypothetical protein
MRSRPALQLNLFPIRGFGLLLHPGQLAVDLRTALPVIRATRRSINRVKKVDLPTWLRDYASVVEIEIHDSINYLVKS